MEKVMISTRRLIIIILFIVSVSKIDGWIYWMTLLFGVLFVISFIHLYRFGKSNEMLFYFIGSFILLIILLVHFILE
ncbi:hypothetical protein SAMN05444955_114107 [Lihuaxuella thermophila]|uniref:Uncharacterized protein n=1 Tax=Lihuaxuella thermophila TaxID=1173111 RepID=A0A1H8HMA3_9BACL|nr:hypothetical protein SAMN05444955_114107 [Lihuaxuella thermophila]